MPGLEDNPYLIDNSPAAPVGGYDEIIERHSARTGLDPNLVRAVIGQESSGNRKAVSPKGARGLMQLMPGTAARFKVRNVNDPEDNIRAGTDYLKFLHDEFNGDTDLMLAGYNAGEGAVKKYGNKIPPYRETQNYVPAVKARYQKLSGGIEQNPYLVDPQKPAKPDNPYLVDTSEPLEVEQQPQITGTGRGAGMARRNQSPNVGQVRRFGAGPVAFPRLTTNDTEWHFGEYIAKPSRQALKVLREAVVEDARKRAAGQTEFVRSPSYQAEMRKRAGLPPLPPQPVAQSNIPKVEDIFSSVRDNTRTPTFDEDRQQRLRQTTPRNLREVEDAEMAQRRRIEQDAAVRPQRENAALLDRKLTPEQDVNERIGAEVTQQRETQQHEAEYRHNKPQIDRLAAQYRDLIKGAGRMRGEQWSTETVAGGVAPWVEQAAGLIRQAADSPVLAAANPLAALVGKTVSPDTLQLHAAAIQQAAEKEGADRNSASKLAQNLLSGFIGSAPELATMSAGIPAPVVFGAGEGNRAYGAKRPIAPAVAHGALTGAAFELPIRNPLTRGAAVGATTAGIDLAGGASPKEALQSGIVNAAMSAAGGRKDADLVDGNDSRVFGARNGARGEVGELGELGDVTQTRSRQSATGERDPFLEKIEERLRLNDELKQREEGLDSARQTEAQRQGVQTEQSVAREVQVRPNLADKTQTQAGSALSRDVSLDRGVSTEAGPRSVSGEIEQPQRFQHLQFGEVEVLPDQSGARSGRLKVAEVNDPEAIHYVKKADLRGRGNERMVPIREPSIDYKTPEGRDESVNRIIGDLHKEFDQVTPEDMAEFEREMPRTQGTLPSSEVSPVVREGEKPRSYQAVQDAIDAREAELEKWGVNVMRLYDSAEKGNEHLPSDWKPMPDDLAKLYRERDAVGAGELKQSVGELSGRLRATGLSEAESDAVLSEFSLGRGTDSTAQYMAAEHTQRIAAKSPRELTENVYMTLAQQRGIDTRAIDSTEDIGRYGETKTLEDAAKAVRAIKTYFAGESLPEQKAIQPSPQAEAVKPERRTNVESTVRVNPLSEALERAGLTLKTRGRDISESGQVKSDRAGKQASFQGQEGFVNPGQRKYVRAKTPVLQDVERATQSPAKGASLSQRLREIPQGLQTALTSQFTPLRVLERTLYGKTKIAGVDLARKFEQVAGAPGKAEADIIEFKKNVISPIKQHAEDFNSYLFLKRVEDRLSKDPERKKVAGWTVERAHQGLEELRAKVGDGVMAKMEAAGEVYQAEMRKALRLQVESGRMSEDLYKSILDSNDFYAPFKVLRHIENGGEGFLPGSGNRIATTQALTKKISGIHSEDFQLGNILQGSAEQIVRSRILAEKNFKMLELDKLADRDPSGQLIKRVKSDHVPRSGYEIVRYLKDGQPVSLEVQRSVAKAVQGLNAQEAGLLTRALMVARQPLRLGATSANASFQAVNLLFADLPRAALISRYGIRSPVDAVRFPMDWVYSAYSSLKGNFGKPNDLYMDWLKSGAAHSTIQRELTPGAFKATLGLAQGPKHLAKSVIDTVPKFSNAIEETSKILGLKRGMRIEQVMKLKGEARQNAMDQIVTEVRNYSGSPDFSRRGTETQQLNLLFMFLNARIQGTAADFARLAGRTGKKDAAVAWGRLGIAVGLPTTVLALINSSPGYKEDYDKIPEWERKAYFMIPRESYFINEDSGEKVRDYWRIPKREIVGMFANTIESGVYFARDRDPKATSEWATGMLENLSPVNITGKTRGERLESVVGSLNPALKVPVEIATGRDTFRHRDIVPDSMKNVTPEEQYRASTPDPYVRLGKALKTSPLVVEHAVQGVTGGGISQFSIRKPQHGRSPLTQYPLVKRFVRSGQVEPDQGMSERAQAVEEKETTERVVRRREAIKLLDSWEGLSSQAIASKIAATGKKDPKLAEEIISLRLEGLKGLTRVDRQIKALGIENGEREKFIQSELARMKTKAERVAFMRDLERKGLLPKRRGGAFGSPGLSRPSPPP